jgi:hypothetical protein
MDKNEKNDEIDKIIKNVKDDIKWSSNGGNYTDDDLSALGNEIADALQADDVDIEDPDEVGAIISDIISNF